jgi:hypothetical protein
VGPFSPTAILPSTGFNCGNKSADSRRDRPEILVCRIEGEWQSIGNDYQTVHLGDVKNVSSFVRAFTIELRARRSLCATVCGQAVSSIAQMEPGCPQPVDDEINWS